jgi:hypothetical protein
MTAGHNIRTCKQEREGPFLRKIFLKKRQNNYKKGENYFKNRKKACKKYYYKNKKT